MRFRRKVLLVDHDAQLTRVVSEALMASGDFELREERDDRVALHFARWFQPDIILLDSSAGPMLSLALALQSDPFLSGTPVICLSGLVKPDRLVSSGMLDGYSFDATPVALEDLVRAVQGLCDRGPAGIRPLEP